MTTRVLILHAYSASNAGDGLLVAETVRLVRAAYGPDSELTILASQPESFGDIDATIHPTVPTWRGWNRDYVRTLRTINDFDIAIAVGGGYLRSGTLNEAAKSILVHGPQLTAASRARIPTVYLPQSVGPVRFGLRAPVQRRLRNIDRVFLRDDRSVEEFPRVSSLRFPDLATIGLRGPLSDDCDPTPVLSVRSVHGRVPAGLFPLAERLGKYDVYVQSTTSGNDDRPASDSFRGRRIVPRGELMTEQASGSSARIVIAVRLHAALMALRAGHYVVHLAYERKGFGAFDDLGISDHVHNVNRFDVDAVHRQVLQLRDDPEARATYRDRLASSYPARARIGESIVEHLQNALKTGAGHG